MEILRKPVCFPVHPQKHLSSFIRHLLGHNGRLTTPNKPTAIIGGYPLYLAGGATSYGDIDVYTFDYETLYWWANMFITGNKGNDGMIRATRHTAIYRKYGEEWQLVRPHRDQPDADSVLYSTDLSPSACQLVHDNGWEVRVLYPEDIENKICRILFEHEWTPYRAMTYKKKGYNIFYSDGTPYVIPDNWVAPGEIYKPV